MKLFFHNLLQTYYFLKTKYTANTRKINAKKWFHLKDSFLNSINEKTTNTISVITSCNTFNCSKLNGPPLPAYPIRLAGTWKTYSKRAIDQLTRITAIRPYFVNMLQSLNLRWPYQANVIKTLESKSKAIVVSVFN